jgi:hypothetical protein
MSSCSPLSRSAELNGLSAVVTARMGLDLLSVFRHKGDSSQASSSHLVKRHPLVSRETTHSKRKGECHVP